MEREISLHFNHISSNEWNKEVVLDQHFFASTSISFSEKWIWFSVALIVNWTRISLNILCKFCYSISCSLTQITFRRWKFYVSFFLCLLESFHFWVLKKKMNRQFEQEIPWNYHWNTVFFGCPTNLAWW